MQFTLIKQQILMKYFYNLLKAINEIMRSAFVNNGQPYDAVKRLYVKEEIYEKVVEILKEKILEIKLGDPKD